MLKDLVCGMDVDEKKAESTSHYKGRLYAFCSASCKTTFEKDPERFIKITSDEQ